jgi:DNA-binding MarR family transcriptional regulator
MLDDGMNEAGHNAEEAFERIERAIVLLSRGPRLSDVHRMLSHKGGIHLDRAAYVSLALLVERGPLRLSDLADQAGVDISTMSRLASRLESLGLADSSPSPTDRRVSMLAATAAGHELYQRVRSIRREELCRRLEGWSAEDLCTLATLLTRFTENLLDTKTEDTSC